MALAMFATAAVATPATAAPVLKYRVNAGGPALPGAPIPWSVDTTATPSPYVSVRTGDNWIYRTTARIDLSDPTIPVGTPEAVFQTERWDTNPPRMVWTFPVEADKDYLVRLYLGEMWPGAQSPGGRLFDVKIEAQQVLDDYDQYLDAGPNSGTVRSFRIAAAKIDGATLDIFFGRVKQNPAIKGIEILEVGPGDDTTAPDTAVTSHPRSLTKKRDARFGFQASEPGATFACRMDFQPWRSCAPGQTYAGLSDGTHLFRVRAIDALRNADQTAARHEFVVDGTPARVSRLKLRPKAFAAARRGRTLTKPRRGHAGTLVRYRLSEPARVVFKVLKATKRRGSTRWIGVRGSGRQKGRKGINRVRFTGRLNGASLRPGSYRLAVTTRDRAGNRSTPTRARFRITP